MLYPLILGALAYFIYHANIAIKTRTSNVLMATVQRIDICLHISLASRLHLSLTILLNIHLHADPMVLNRLFVAPFESMFDQSFDRS